MSRRAFENKSRKENTREIKSVRDNFHGMYKDVPANELAPAACRDIVNATAFVDTMNPREGMWGNSQLFVSSAFQGDTGTEYPASKTTISGDYVVTLTGHTASVAYADSYIIYNGNDAPDRIIDVYSANSYRVRKNAPIPTSVLSHSTTAHIRPKVFGSLYHKKLGVYIMHLGRTILKIAVDPLTGSLGNWTLIVQSGDTQIPAQKSKIREMGDDAIIFCGGIFKVSIGGTASNQIGSYYKANNEPATNSLACSNYPLNGNFRRYLYTMTKQSSVIPGSTPLFFDRATNLIQQETGSNLLNAANIDFAEAYTQQVPAGDLTTTYQILKGGTGVTTTVGLTGNCFFNATVDGNTYTISYSIAATATLNQIATAITTSMRSLIADTCLCQYVSSTSNFWFRNVSPNSTESYLTSPAAVSGYTDIRDTLKGTVALGATIVNQPYYTQPELTSLNTNTNWKAYTHFSLYTTRQLVKESTGAITGNPSAFAWAEDYPIMRSLVGSISATALTVTKGKLLSGDLGQNVTVVNTSSFACVQCKVSAVLSPTTATLDTSFGAGTYYIFAGASEGIVFNSSGLTWTVTQSLKTADISTTSYAGAEAMRSFSVGDPLFTQDGNVYYIYKINSPTSFDVNDANGVLGDLTGVIAAVAPKNFTSGTHTNIIKDQFNDSTISSRIGTLGLRSRFYRAMPALSTGLVIPGFVVGSYLNKYYWNDIGSDQQYIIGNNHPTYQVEQVNDAINAFSINQNSLCIYTRSSTYASTTNLNLTFTDPNNGNTVFTLPKPVLIDMYLGCKSDNHLIEFEGAKTIVMNQDYGVRTFDGTAYSNNLDFKMIQSSLKPLGSIVISYDETYGVIIMGTTETNGIVDLDVFDSFQNISYDKFFTLGVREDKYTGASEFQNVPFPDFGVQPILFKGRASYFAHGPVPVSATDSTLRFHDGYNVSFVTGSYKDTPDTYYNAYNPPGIYYSIPWSFTTGDDIASGGQSLLMTHEESHLYTSGRSSNEEPLAPITINMTAYNDVGTYVTLTKSIGTFPLYGADIVFDKRVEGHRIRYKFDFDSADLVVNGMDTYYVTQDRACNPDIRIPTENAVYQAAIAAPVVWVSRYSDIINLSGPALTTNSVARATGPDGRSSTGIISNDPADVIVTTPSSATGTSFLMSFWIYGTAGTHYVLSCSNGVSVSVIANTLYVSGTTLNYTKTVTTQAGWTHFLIAKVAGTSCKAYQDGTEITGTNAIDNVTFATTTTVQVAINTATIYDLRILDGTYTAAVWDYYRADVLLGGDNTGPAA